MRRWPSTGQEVDYPRSQPCGHLALGLLAPMSVSITSVVPASRLRGFVVAARAGSERTLGKALAKRAWEMEAGGWTHGAESYLYIGLITRAFGKLFNSKSLGSYQLHMAFVGFFNLMEYYRNQCDPEG